MPRKTKDEYTTRQKRSQQKNNKDKQTPYSQKHIRIHMQIIEKKKETNVDKQQEISDEAKSRKKKKK